MKIPPEKLNRKTIKNLPEREWNVVSEYDEIYIIPSGLKHDSGYMMIAIVGVKVGGDMEVCAYPDDICWNMMNLNQKYDSTGMRTDCYYPNGVLRFHGRGIKYVVEEACSSTTIRVESKQLNV